MHKTCRDFVTDHQPEGYESVLEVGSLDLNGGVRDLLNPEASYLGIDLQEGPGVDLVADILEYRGEPVDLVLCLNVLEHSEKWPFIIEGCWENLRPGGFLMLTCSNIGTNPHSGKSARAGPPDPDEYYAPVRTDELRRTLIDFFVDFDMASDLLEHKVLAQRVL